MTAPEIAILALWLAAVLAFFAPALQRSLKALLRRRSGWIWTVPVLLTLAFAGSALAARALTVPLGLAALGYTSAPTLCAFLQRSNGVKHPSAVDFLSVLLLWLPLEFGAGGYLVPRPAQGFLHAAAYGMALVLALSLFAGFRGFTGMKIHLPHRARDLQLPLVAFALLAPILAILGIAIGFIPPPHLPSQSATRMAASVGLIFVGTALPEEILFRTLIQNLLMQRFGRGGWTLLGASVIFGCAHLDNGPQPLPNWRYAILATIAGWAYGKVFEKSSSVCSSAILHMLVDWTKHVFF